LGHQFSVLGVPSGTTDTRKETASTGRYANIVCAGVANLYRVPGASPGYPANQVSRCRRSPERPEREAAAPEGVPWPTHRSTS
jgi:hypothetical protein